MNCQILKCILVFCLVLPLSFSAAGRETVLDGVEYVEKELVREVPAVPPLCDELNLQGRKVDIGGCELYVETEGEGLPLVLLHGGPGSTHHDFHPSFSRAARWAKVIYYDQRGCGRSDYEPGDGYSLNQAVNDLDALRAALGFEKWVVLGHSYGGLLAQAYAVKHPDRLLGLVLVGSSTTGHDINTGRNRQYDFITKAEAARIQQVRNADLDPEVFIFNLHLNGDWKRQNFFRPTREDLARLARYGWKHDDRFRPQILPTLNSVFLDDKFDEWPVPTLIVEGKYDLTWGKEKAANFAECFPEADVLEICNAGHSSFEDAPEKFFGELEGFVTTAAAPPAGAITKWKQAVKEKARAAQSDPAYLLRTLGYGRKSNQKIAKAFSADWLDRFKDPGQCLRVGFALYDAARYDEALAAFKKMAELAAGDTTDLAIARIWQGHMLDLLGKRNDAIDAYQKVAAMNVSGNFRHDQFGIAYSPSAYAKMRIKEPFTRVENKYED